MTTPAAAPAPAVAPSRRRDGWDIALSIVMLVLAVGAVVVGAAAQLFLAAFTDYCPKATCNESGAFFALSITWPITLVILVAGVVAAIILLALRRRAWWVALVTLLLVSAGGIVGILLYIGNVGGFAS